MNAPPKNGPTTGKTRTAHSSRGLYGVEQRNQTIFSITNSMSDEPTTYRTPLASRGTLLLPLTARRIQGGVWLYGAIRTRAVVAQVLSGWIAGRSIRLTPGGSTQWHPPIPETDLADWLLGLEESVGDRIAHAAIQLPSDRRRRRFNFLLANETNAPVAFAKFTMNPPNEMAIEAFRRFGEDPPATFWAPRLLDAGILGGYSYTVTSTMPNRPHFPARLSPQQRGNIIKDIQLRLTGLVHKSAVVMHGDFGAWNVRSFRGGAIAIVDWEATAQGVAVADELWHAISWVSAGTHNLDIARFLRKELPDHDPEVVSIAAQFWLEKLDQSEADEIAPERPMPNSLKNAATRIRGLLEELSELSA